MDSTLALLFVVPANFAWSALRYLDDGTALELGIAVFFWLLAAFLIEVFCLVYAVVFRSRDRSASDAHLCVLFAGVFCYFASGAIVGRVAAAQTSARLSQAVGCCIENFEILAPHYYYVTRR